MLPSALVITLPLNHWLPSCPGALSSASLSNVPSSLNSAIAEIDKAVALLVATLSELQLRQEEYERLRAEAITGATAALRAQHMETARKFKQETISPLENQ